MATEEKPSRIENEYWARHDAELVKSMREAANKKRAASGTAGQPKCPRCLAELSERQVGAVILDECGQCGGVWLDKGELEILQKAHPEKQGSLFGHIFR